MPPFYPERLAAEEAARAAGAFIRTHAGGLAGGDVRSKGTHDLVTFVDEGAQAIIVEHLRRAFPSDAVLAEEGAEARPGPQPDGRRWVVDPLDGTTNFAHGVPPYAVSIALEADGEGVVGVVLDVSSGELFSAARGAGLTLNGRPAGVSATAALGDALVATGFPFRDYRYVDGYLRSFEAVIRATRGVRRHGAAAVDLAWTAVGRFDGFFEAGLAPWDAAAGAVLVREGGGIVEPLVEGADPVYSGGLVAAPPGVYRDLRERLASLAAAYREIGI
jgi:myo-inositol-1(or 4)-monophosphatase